MARRTQWKHGAVPRAPARQAIDAERALYSNDDRDYLVGFVELNKHSDFAARVRRMLRAYDDMNKQRARAVVAFKKLSGSYK